MDNYQSGGCCTFIWTTGTRIIVLLRASIKSMSLDDVLQDMAKDFLMNLLQKTLGKFYESWHWKKKSNNLSIKAPVVFLYYLMQLLPARNSSAEFFLMSFQNELN